MTTVFNFRDTKHPWICQTGANADVFSDCVYDVCMGAGEVRHGVTPGRWRLISWEIPAMDEMIWIDLGGNPSYTTISGNLPIDVYIDV